ncbi:hypothetical protein GGQ74_001200 [Desulfobaculum xiamenense]|uniref:SGNH hydrolase-type esterase domain-containing protein n=1 Tax=Desulfobaculum xiamenense TaxID=995050 RepID=A0A846QKH7_9BACT|nr:hypothetical protein [Desulfobaculum xiamenense]NJB67560.1 hypothetical protein [Desulfobaculum xiamenense]
MSRILLAALSTYVLCALTLAHLLDRPGDGTPPSLTWTLALLFVASIAAQIASKPRRDALALVACSTFVCLLAAEAALHALMPSRLPIPEDCASCDRRSKYEVVRDLRNDGIDAFPTIHSVHWLGVEQTRAAWPEPLLPLAGIARRPTVYCNETGQWLVYDSDEYGFNNPVGTLTAPVDILVVGDSFAHGACVPVDQNIAAQLRALGQRAASIGYGGTGPLTELATLREYAAPLRPGIILWLYYEGNDLTNLKREMQSPQLINYLQPDYSQGLSHQQDKVDAIIRRHVDAELRAAEIAARVNALPLDLLALRELRTRLGILARTAGLMERGSGTRWQGKPISPAILEDMLSRILTLADTETKEWGGRLIFVYLPAFQRIATPQAAHHELKRHIADAAARRANVPFLDAVQLFATHPDPLSLFANRVNAHYSPEGYALLARAALAFTQDTNGEIPARQADAASDVPTP